MTHTLYHSLTHSLIQWLTRSLTQLEYVWTFQARKIAAAGTAGLIPSPELQVDYHDFDAFDRNDGLNYGDDDGSRLLENQRRKKILLQSDVDCSDQSCTIYLASIELDISALSNNSFYFLITFALSKFFPRPHPDVDNHHHHHYDQEEN